MFSILIILTAIIFGLLLVRSFHLDLYLKEKISLGVIIGIELSSIIFFIFSLLFGLNNISISITLGLMLIIIFYFLFKLKLLDFVEFKFKRIFHDKFLLFLFIFWTIIFTKIFFQQFVYEKDGLYVGWIGSYGDGALHLSLIHSFVFGDNFFPTNPVFSGIKLSYPFLSDFYSAVLVKCGLTIGQATALPSVVLLVALVVLIYSFFSRITKSKIVAFIAVFIVFFTGGLGFWQFFDDISKSNLLMETLKFPPHEYTHLDDKNIQFINLVSSALIPQRASIFGLPMFLSVLLIIKVGLEKLQKRYFFVAAILTALMPFLHAHSLLALIMVLLIIAPLSLIKNSHGNFKGKLLLWSIFSLVSLAVITPQFVLFYPDNSSRVMFLKIGWLTTPKDNNPFIFWFKNAGFLPILTFLAFFIASKEKIKEFLFYYLPFVVLFIISNFIIFQPYDYDNSKILYYWYIFSSPLAAYFIVRIWKTKYLKLIGISLFVITIASGALDVFRLTNYQKNKIQLIDKKSIKIAHFIKNKTSPKSIFVTASNHNHPVPTLAGRTILMGYPGWLWTYAIDYSQREADITEIYSATDRVKSLINFYNVDYIFIGPIERERYVINEPFYEKNFPIIYKDNDFKIFKVNNEG